MQINYGLFFEFILKRDKRLSFVSDSVSTSKNRRVNH